MFTSLQHIRICMYSVPLMTICERCLITQETYHETRNFEIALESVELSFTGKVYLRDRPFNIMEGGGGGGFYPFF